MQEIHESADRYIVMQFHIDGDGDLVAKYEINRLTLPELRKLFGIDEHNPMYDCFPVTESQRVAIEDDLGIKLNLSNFEYQLSCE